MDAHFSHRFVHKKKKKKKTLRAELRPKSKLRNAILMKISPIKSQARDTLFNPLHK